LLADPEFRDKLSKDELDELFQPESYLRHVKKIYRRAGVIS
jgi:adenylosuccinate lyase